MRIALEPAYVLHHRPYQDSGLLLEIFTPSHGRAGLVAKGVRKSKGRWQSLLQPFVPLLLSWSGRGELGTVTDAEMSGVPHALQGQVLLSGFYINELLIRLLHRHDPHAELFDYYHDLLQQLALLNDDAAGRQQLQWQLRLFEKQLLQEIGYGLVLEHDVVSGAAIEPDVSYAYHLGEGPVPLMDGADADLVIGGGALLALASGELEDAALLRDAKRLMRAALDQHLGGKPLHSRQLLMDLQRTTEAVAAAQKMNES